MKATAELYFYFPGRGSSPHGFSRTGATGCVGAGRGFNVMSVGERCGGG